MWWTSQRLADLWSTFLTSQQWLWDRIGDLWGIPSGFLMWFATRSWDTQVFLLGIYLFIGVMVGVIATRRTDPRTHFALRILLLWAMTVGWLPLYAYLVLCFFTLAGFMFFYGLWMMGGVYALGLAIFGYIGEVTLRLVGIVK